MIDPKRAALVMIDMQKGFISPDSSLCVAGAQATVPACARALRAARSAGMAVFHVRRTYAADGSDVEPVRYRTWLEGGRPLCLEGDDPTLVDAPDELQPENGDRIIRAALDRFAQNMRFYQSLNIGQLGAMSYIDNYLFFDGGYLSMLLTCYEGNSDLAKQELEALKKAGVDIWGCYKRAILRTADGSTDAARNVYFATQMFYDLAEPEEIDKFFNDNDDCAQIVAELLRHAAQNE